MRLAPSRRPARQIRRALTRAASLVGLASLATVAGCALDPAPPGTQPPLLTSLPRELSAAERRIIDASNDLSLRLLRQVANPDSNIVVSPLSVTVVLAMLQNGAHGSAAADLQDFLGLGDLSLANINAGYAALLDLLPSLDSRTTMRVANGIFASDAVTLNPRFQQTVTGSFDAAVRTLRFSAPGTLDTINGWASRQTAGRIPTILEEIAPEDVLYAINAMYFEAKWRTPFEKSRTVPAPFRSVQGDVNVPTMRGENIPIATYPVPGGRAGELLYGNGAYAFTIVLPTDTSRTALGAVLASLTSADVSRTTVGTSYPSLDVHLPRFSLEWNRLLNDDLKALGLTEVFTHGLDSLFTGPVGGDPFLSAVRQKAMIEVDEEGTVAAAVTVGTVGVTSAPMPFVVDRPFAFFIRERISGTILFAGQVVRLGD